MLDILQLLFITNLVYHPIPREILCIELMDTYYCQDKREIFVGCTYKFNTAICPELTPA